MEQPKSVTKIAMYVLGDYVGGDMEGVTSPQQTSMKIIGILCIIMTDYLTQVRIPK